MEIRFLLSLIVLLGGIWIYLLGMIIHLTNAKEEIDLLFLGVTHFVVLVYLLLALTLLYRMGLMAAGLSPERDRPPKAVEVILFSTWPVAIIGPITGLTISKLPIRAPVGISSVALMIVGLLSLVWTRLFLRTEWLATFKKYSKALFCFFLSLPLVGMMYVIMMSTILADVEIMTDKQFYHPDDPIMVSVLCGGYVLRPYIAKMSFGVYTKVPQSDVNLPDLVFVVTPDPRRGALIEVTLRTHVLSVSIR